MGCASSTPDEECRICFKPSNNLLAPYDCEPVEHRYCQPCYLKWCETQLAKPDKHVSCPTCRADLKDEERARPVFQALYDDSLCWHQRVGEMRMYHVLALEHEQRRAKVVVVDPCTPDRVYNMRKLLQKWSHKNNTCMRHHQQFAFTPSRFHVRFTCITCLRSQSWFKY